MKLPQFTLRDLFWLVLVCAIGCAWWLREQAMESHAAELEIAQISLIAAQQELAQAEAEIGKRNERIADLMRTIQKPGGLHSRRSP